VWSPRIEHDRDFLLDAVIAGITTGASAIGRGRGPDDGFLDGSGLTGRIVSHDAATRLPDIVDGSLTAWTDRGARVYAIGTDLEER
jgi:hypothetical protein